MRKKLQRALQGILVFLAGALIALIALGTLLILAAMIDSIGR